MTSLAHLNNVCQLHGKCFFQYTSCINEGKHAQGQFWCSVTSNFDTMGLFGFCPMDGSPVRPPGILPPPHPVLPSIPPVDPNARPVLPPVAIDPPVLSLPNPNPGPLRPSRLYVLYTVNNFKTKYICFEPHTRIEHSISSPRGGKPGYWFMKKPTYEYGRTPFIKMIVTNSMIMSNN